MRPEHFFPVGLVCMQLLACIVYAVSGHFLKSAYWFFATGITIVVILLGE